MQRFEAVERFFELALLGLVASGFLALAGSGQLDLPTILLGTAGLALRALMVSRLVRFDLAASLVNLVTLCYIGFFAADYFWLSRALLPATVHLVCFLAVVKILSARTSRDYVYTASISLMELVAAAMLPASFGFFGFLALYLVFAIAAFTSAEMRRAMAKPGTLAASAAARVGPRLAVLTTLVTLGILTLTICLFVVLPRTANVAFRRWIPSSYHLTGFSSDVTLGQIGEIQKDSRAVMHVKPSQYSARLPPDLKWRGAALSRFDGKRWTDLSAEGRATLSASIPLILADDAQRLRQDGSRLLYRVDLNMGDSDALFIAGIPEFLNIEHYRVVRTPADGYRLAALPTDTVRYEVSSFLPNGLAAAPGRLTAKQREKYLQLPSDLDRRIPALAHAWAGAGDGMQWGTRLEKHLRHDFGYTLELPASPPADPLADFLFRRKKGHCEYFASAMVVMLRTLGVPARIVNGFQSGVWNPVSGMYVIRASDAHSWVEAYDAGSGWVTFDPTPSAARGGGNGLLAKAALYVDAAQTFWEEWVVHYDLGRQVTLAGKLEERTRGLHWGLSGLEWNRWKQRLRGGSPWISRALWALLATACLISGLWRMVPLWTSRRMLGRGKITPADASRFYERMLRTMRRRGYQKPPWFTPAEFAATLPDSELGACVGAFTEHYMALRFGGNAAAAVALGSLLEKMERL